MTAALAGYRGARRRLEFKGEADGVRVLDSYAHHPTELAADLRAARDIVAGGSGGHGGVVSSPGGPGGRVPPDREASTAQSGHVIAVFQPHLFSRTRIFADEFGAALGLADEVVVMDVYAAREDPEPGVTGRLVAERRPWGTRAVRPRPGAGRSGDRRVAAPGDVVLTMGAGDVTLLGPQLVEALRRRSG